MVSLPLLTSLISGQGGYTSALETTPGGEVDTPDLTTLSDVSLTFSGGRLNLVGLTTIVGSSIAVSGGVVLSLPAQATRAGPATARRCRRRDRERAGAAGPDDLGGGIQRQQRGGMSVVRPRAGRCRCRS